MAQLLTDKTVKDLQAPPSGNRITYDGAVKGFGVRVTTAGAKAFILNYRIGGRERRITIGDAEDWRVKDAREQARALKRQVDVGDDPMAERDEERQGRTIADLCDLFEREFLPSRRLSTQADYRSLLRMYVRPRFGKLRVAGLQHTDIERLHREIAKRAPYRANRLVAVLSVMMNVAVKEGWREGNPVKGVEKAREEKRERFLSPAEIARLADALAAHHDRVQANAIRLLLLTGARRAEVMTATWDQFDLGGGVWTKPSANTKQRKAHRVPLSAPALALLTEIKSKSVLGDPYVFPGRAGGPLTDMKQTWATVCKVAGISGVRVHDLRHTFASVLASSGLSLPIIGALLGHTQPGTTARYAHLLDDPLRAATERAGAVITGAGKSGGEVVPIAGGRRP